MANPDPKKNQKALLACYGGGHVNMILPVYFELMKRGYEVVIIGFTAAQEKLSKIGVKFLSVKDFVETEDAYAIQQGYSLTKAMELNNTIGEYESAAYMGISYTELEQKFGSLSAAEKYEKYGRQCFLPINFAHRILNKVKPDFLVTTNSPRMEKALILAARSRMLPNFCIVDFGDDEEIEDRLAKRRYGDKVFVSFSKIKDKLINAGRIEREIIVSGNPAFDYLKKLNVSQIRNDVRERLGLKEKKVILWCKSVMKSLKLAEKQIECSLADLQKRFPEIVVMSREHPNKNASNSKNFSDVFTEATEYELSEILPATDILVTINSSVGIEASILNKKVLQVLLYEFAEKMSFVELGIGEEVYDLETLNKEILGLNSSDRGDIPLHGSSTEIICDEIQKTCG